MSEKYFIKLISNLLRKRKAKRIKILFFTEVFTIDVEPQGWKMYLSILDDEGYDMLQVLFYPKDELLEPLAEIYNELIDAITPDLEALINPDY